MGVNIIVKNNYKHIRFICIFCMVGDFCVNFALITLLMTLDLFTSVVDAV